MDTRIITIDSLAQAAYEDNRARARRSRPLPFCPDHLIWISLESLVSWGPIAPAKRKP